MAAPGRYLEGARRDAFSGYISHERIAEHWRERLAVETNPELMARFEHRIETLEQAIDQHRRGYAPVVSDEVTGFWQAYWELASMIAPQLELEDPGAKPLGAAFVAFPHALHRFEPLSTMLRHKLRQGRVDIDVAGLGDDLEALGPRLTALLPEGAQVRRAGKSTLDFGLGSGPRHVIRSEIAGGVGRGWNPNRGQAARLVELPS